MARRSSATDEPRVVSPGFHARVYAIVRAVPRGRVATYGQIAAILGSPRVARHVGFALAAATWPPDDPVPWHRIINARGGLSTADPERQKQHLRREQVHVDDHDRVDLARYRWPGPESEKRANSRRAKPQRAH